MLPLEICVSFYKSWYELYTSYYPVIMNQFHVWPIVA
nr:MAG TPA: hypothetical protein [Caudoviricetes sp.]